MTSNTNSIEVLIGGKVYRLAGTDPSYLQRLSSYINKKLKECQTSEGYRGFDADYRSLLLNLNIADDYFKAEEKKEELEKQKEELEKELYSMRHELVSIKMKLENAVKQQEAAQTELSTWKEKLNSQKRGYSI